MWGGMLTVRLDGGATVDKRRLTPRTFLPYPG